MTDAAALADALLDAQVEWIVAELSGRSLAAAVARDVDDVLAFAGTVTLASVVDAASVKASARRFVDVVGGSSVLEELQPDLADAVYHSAAGETRLLGDVVGREHVDALFTKLLGMHQLHDRAIARLGESPVVASIASTYVSKIVGDFVQQNRERAERVPGVSSLFSMGLGAANRVKGAADGLLGDAQQRSASFAMRQTSGAMRDVLRDAPIHEAAMQIWDVHADEPVSELREYLSARDLRELLAIIGDIATTARNHDVVGGVLDDCIDVFFARYGGTDLATLLAELGLTRDVLVEEIRRFAAPVVDAARADGSLAQFARTRLEPFFTAPSTLALLGGDAPVAKADAKTKTKTKTKDRPKPKKT